jgi:hypothetical protein
MILWIGLGPTNKAQAQIVYGYTMPLYDGGADSSGSTYNSGSYFPVSSGYSGMMYTWGYPANYGTSGMNESWRYSPWNTSNSRWSTSGSSPSFRGTANQSWSNRWSGSNQWNGMGLTGMNSGFGGMMNMGMRRR